MNLHSFEQDAHQIQTLAQFKEWTRETLRLLLPHGALVCGHGRVHSAGVSMDYVIAVDYPPEHLNAIRNSAGGIDTPIMRRWIVSRQPQVFSPGDPWPEVSSDWLDHFKVYRLGETLAHATVDEANCIGTYFSLHRLPEPPSSDLIDRLVQITPALHQTLMRVVRHYESTPSQNPLTLNNVVLSARESEIAGLIGIGKSNHDIARLLDLSENTIKHHVTRILDKTGCTNRARIVVAVQQQASPMMGTKVL
ncbi:MAG: helix-turn-helix transcriptional regulator [Rhodocyclales bacterium]|nr:helix-turn-helix transcriptional regulator [Rhodocyclales bacterium]